MYGGDLDDVGIVMQGGLYNTVLRSLEMMGLADVFGKSRIPLYVLNVTYPLVPEEFTRFAAGKRALLIVEEGQPEYIEQSVNQFLRNADIQTRVVGKGPLPMAGEYTGGVVSAGIKSIPRRMGAARLGAGGRPRGPAHPPGSPRRPPRRRTSAAADGRAAQGGAACGRRACAPDAPSGRFSRR